MNIEFVDRLSIALCRRNPNKCYLFGDNLEGWGKKGQAVIRDEPNAIGIPTKVAPRWDDDANFTDDNGGFETYRQLINDAFNKIPNGVTVVIPTDGLGTGLAQLPKRAPKLYQHILDHLIILKGD